MSPNAKNAQKKKSKIKEKRFDVRFLMINQPPGKMDPLVRNSITHTGEWCLDQIKPDLGDQNGEKNHKEIRKFLYEKLLKHASKISVITKKLNTDSALINTKTRSLLANLDIYMYLLYDTIKTMEQPDVRSNKETSSKKQVVVQEDQNK